jgi:hypothetical protein
LKPRCLIVVGTLASNPYAGMAWMHMQIAVGLRRLGHDAYYFETTSTWPYDPVRQAKVCDSDYSVPYLARVAESFGLADRWAYRRSYSDKEWIGIDGDRARELLKSADAVFNVTGATRLQEQGLDVRRLVYLGTDPGRHEIGRAKGDADTLAILEEHDDFVTYGENIGTPCCPIPPLSPLLARTRQPVLMDVWQNGPPTKPEFTTVGNWKQTGGDLEFCGDTYYWSKDREFLKFIDLPQQSGQALELALGLSDPAAFELGRGEVVAAPGVPGDMRAILRMKGWLLSDALAFSTDPWRYRDYVASSRGEFTVAKDLNVRLRTGWFSERSACYLAAGRPVITQDTGFGTVLPTGEGLFAFNSLEDILAAFEAIESDYARHSRAAAEIAHEYFSAEKVLAALLDDLGI